MRHADLNFPNSRRFDPRQHATVKPCGGKRDLAVRLKGNMRGGGDWELEA